MTVAIASYTSVAICVPCMYISRKYAYIRRKRSLRLDKIKNRAYYVRTEEDMMTRSTSVNDLR